MKGLQIRKSATVQKEGVVEEILYSSDGEMEFYFYGIFKIFSLCTSYYKTNGYNRFSVTCIIQSVYSQKYVLKFT